MTPATETSAVRFLCDKCGHEWSGDRDGRCPRCHVGIDIGNVILAMQAAARRMGAA